MRFNYHLASATPSKRLNGPWWGATLTRPMIHRHGKTFRAGRRFLTTKTRPLGFRVRNSPTSTPRPCCQSAAAKHVRGLFLVVKITSYTICVHRFVSDEFLLRGSRNKSFNTFGRPRVYINIYKENNSRNEK